MRGDIFNDAFWITPAENGGWCICTPSPEDTVDKTWSFATFEALIEWLEDEHDGYKIGKMGKRNG